MNIIWVSTAGNDLDGDGSQGAPYASLERALGDFTNGDQIRILDGTFIPTDSIVISGLEGSIFAETPLSVYIQPEKTRAHQACVAIIDAPRFSIIGVNILQAADTTGNLIGLYVENVENFLAYTCAISDFSIPSGSGYGIFASGDGRIEECLVSNIVGTDVSIHGIKGVGVDVIECEVTQLSGVGACQVIGIEEDGLKTW